MWEAVGGRIIPRKLCNHNAYHTPGLNHDQATQYLHISKSCRTWSRGLCAILSQIIRRGESEHGLQVFGKKGLSQMSF